MHGFWDFFWLLLTSFLFIAYLLVLFSIFGDLFRDRGLSGWAKAGWVVLLLVFPLLGSLAYLIFRGPSMAERSVASAAAVKTETEDYIRSVATAGTNPTEQIARAHSLLEAGVIDETEFARLKAAALAQVG